MVLPLLVSLCYNLRRGILKENSLILFGLKKIISSSILPKMWILLIDKSVNTNVHIIEGKNRKG